MKRNIIVGLDLGTTKTAAAVGEINPDRSLAVLAVSKTDSTGLRKGNIVDIEATSRAVDQVLEEVERISGIHINSVKAAFNGASISSILNRATVAVGQPNQEITHDDVTRAIQAARMVAVPPDRSVVHTIPRQYTVDGFEGVVDPAGMVGSRLEVEVVIITALTASLQNMVKAVNRTGTRVEEIVVSGLMSAESVLQPAEKEIGVVLVDIGGGTTDIVVFEQGAISFATVLPVGGDYITRDLAIVLRTTMEEARRIKEKYGTAIANDADDNNMLEISSIYGHEKHKISEKMVASIIQPRVEEMLEMVDSELRRSGYTYKGMLPAGAVFTGGTALLKGIGQLGEEFLGMPVRIGYPENAGRIPGDYFSPEYSAVLGILLYGSRMLSAGGSDEFVLSISGMFNRVKDWFRDMFR